jgi:nucleotide-binding universal stress UspA family protein
MYRSVLVPLDGSTFGEHALPLAAGIARRAKAALEFVQVHVPLAGMYVDRMPPLENTLDPMLRQQERAYLDAVVRRLSDLGDASVTAALVEGPVLDALQERVKATGTDLIVMTTHGRGPLARAWLGSVADGLVRRVGIPVLLVRPQETAPDLAREPAPLHVLIPLDGSDLAERIIEPAVALGVLLEAEYTLLRVIKPMVIGNYNPSDAVVGGLDYSLLRELQTLHEQDRKDAQKYLEAVAARLRERSLRARTRVAVNAQPAVAILDEVKANRIDLVALETHGRSGLPRLFLGSVADKVLRGATVPVLVQRPPAG